MITRHYKCDKCGVIEQNCSIHEPVKDKCDCGEDLKRLYSADITPVLWHQHNRNQFTPIRIQQEIPIL